MLGASPALASSFTTTAVADAAVRFGANQGTQYGALPDLYVRQRDGNSAGQQIREFVAYVRFNIYDIPDPNDVGVRITGATIRFTKVTSERNDTINADRFQLLGLNNVSGNTSQTWDEATMSYVNAGAEWNTGIFPSPTAGSSPFHSDRTTLFTDGAGITESIVDGDWVPTDGAPTGSVSVTGDGLTLDPSIPEGEWSWTRDPLAQFPQDRLDDDGNATFIVDFPTHGNSSRGYGLGSREQETLAYRPTLTVTYGLIPELSTGLLLATGLLGLALRRRRR